MAEIIGTASAIVGIAAFAAQAVEKINTLNAAYRYNRTQAPILIESLISNLETFHLSWYHQLGTVYTRHQHDGHTEQMAHGRYKLTLLPWL